MGVHAAIPPSFREVLFLLTSPKNSFRTHQSSIIVVTSTYLSKWKKTGQLKKY